MNIAGQGDLSSAFAVPATPRSQRVSDNFNYKRLVDAWRKGVDYTTVSLMTVEFEPPKKSSLVASLLDSISRECELLAA